MKEADLSTTSPAQLYATVAGALLAILGVVGFLYESSFATGVPGVESADVLGVLSVNGWASLLYLVLGLGGLAAASSGAARPYALGFGLLLVVIAAWGLVDPDGVILSVLPVNTAASAFGLVLGLAGVGAGAATPAPRARS